jgi:outer membrane phospholipase A
MRFLLTSLLLAAAATLHAAPGLTLLPPAARWISGETVVLETLAGDRPPPETVNLQVTNARGFVERIEARRVAVEGPVGRYRATMPASVSGRLLVSLEADRRAPYVVEVLARGTAADVAAAPNYEADADAAQGKAPPPLEFTWVDAFYTHEPLYFVGGLSSDSDAKFQLSFKYRIYSRETNLPKRLADGWLAPDGLYATYTQTSLWDIAAHSSPFRDTSYKPGLYWQERDLWYRENESGRARLSLMAGIEHESNGRGTFLSLSRSINVAVVRPSLGYVTAQGWRFLVSPKVYAYLEKTDNEDIAEYRGYADLHLTARMPSADPEGGLQLSLIGRLGTDTDHHSVQADLTYPIRVFDVPGFLAFQVFNGHGEAILDYNRRRATQLRLGFAAVR